MVTHHFLSENLKKQINQVSVVSFDIFDTLLVRPYAYPTDVFLHMEKVLHKPLFQVCRIEAECIARKKNPNLKDITLDMIYAEIDDTFKDMKPQELNWERMILRTNPEMKAVWDYAKQAGKKIVIASDMYLPTDFIASVLRQNGYDGWDKLYVSGDLNSTKCSGDLYRRILNDLGVEARQVLHIGDNRKSDFIIPERLGIPAIRYLSVFKQFRHTDRRYEKYRDQAPLSLGLSILFGVLAYDRICRKCASDTPNTNYWGDLGYCYAGPVGYAYTRFVDKTASDNGIGGLLFVARDGYLLQKIFNTFHSEMPSAYIYAPRFLNHICRLDYIRKNTAQAQAIIDFYRGQSPEINALFDDTQNPHDFIQTHKKLFQPLSEIQMDRYRSYLKRHIPQVEKYALVDTITGEFSSQKILQAALQKEVLGIYWGICEEHSVHKYDQRTFMGIHHGQAPDYFTLNWNFMEFLMTSPEHPVKDIGPDDNPIFADRESPYEVKRANLYPDIEAGAMRFVGDIQKWFSGHDIFLSGRDVTDWVNAYIAYPMFKDLQNMSGIYTGEDSMHQHWIPLFLDRTKLWDFIKSPKKTAKNLQKMLWRTPFQSLLLCLKKPLTIHTRKLKNITVALLPHLNRRYLTLSFGNGASVRYRFIIGNIKGD